MKLLASTTIPQLQNHGVGVFQREHEHTPIVVCGINQQKEPLLECGADYYTECLDINRALTEATNKVVMVMNGNQIFGRGGGRSFFS